ncbi:MAG TPA: glycosyltransferase family 4 protein [Candidatus Paceibacterota bacterium]|nr:glycosyltransferase family 4 protein [Candidatus Paceibacterota bacterium]
MTKVLFVSNDPSIFDPKGATHARMRAYAKAIGELHIVSAAPWGTKDAADGPLHLHPVHAWRLFRVAALTRRARALIRAGGIEVVSAQDPFEHGRAAANAIHGTQAKFHVQVHTDFLAPAFARESVKNRVRVALADGVLREAAGIRVVSERVKRSLVARYGSAIPEPSVIPVAVSAEVPPALPLPAHPFKFSLLAAGRLEKEKHIDAVIRALAHVVKQYRIVGLFVVGDGRERKRLERLVRSLGLGEHVRFEGWLPAEQTWSFIRSAQAFVQMSSYEGYGRTLVEAALAKVPIITTDVGIVGDVLKDREDVLVVPAGEPAMLVRAVASLIEDATMRTQLAVHAELSARAHLAAAGDIPSRIAEDLARVAAQK